MSWKSIEMQVALPRSQDAGKLQEQMLKQTQHSQESLAASQLLKDEQKRKRVNEFEKTGKPTIKQGSGQSKQANQDQQHKEQVTEEGQEMDHPYLDGKIDFSG
ncbi:hypothetical protein F3157_04680 [Virgibacillus dakarensis]|nr:hypothetical protein [Virgibacillus dakarensis]